MKLPCSFLPGIALIFTALLSCGQSEAPKTFRFQQEMSIDGIGRTYLLNLPPTFYQESGPDTFPLVVALHGTGGNAEQCERDYGLTARADQSNYIIVYPEGVPRPGPFGVRTWNAGRCCDYAVDSEVDDVKFITAVIDRMIAQYRADPDKVYVTGMSNGAMMSYRLACEIPEKINAIAPVSGTLMAHSCSPDRPVAILHIHSELDKVVPFNGGTGLRGYYFASVDSTLSFWTSINHLSDLPTVSEHYGFVHSSWRLKSRKPIEYYLTKDGGHSWPGGKQARPGADPPSGVIDATELIWEFFQKN